MSSGLWLLVLSIATLAVYFSGLHIWYYGDDFQYVYTDPASRIFHFFHEKNLFHGFYRPVNSAIIAVVQVLFGRETWAIHIINILVHALLAWLIYLFMKRERFTTWQAVLASAFMVISQENASAVLGNDTFSQISGTFFGCLSMWLLYVGYTRNGDQGDASARRFPAGHYLLALLAYVVSLASKETSVAFGPMVFCVLVMVHRNMAGWGARLVRAVMEVIPFLALTLVYIWVRSAIGLSQPSGEGGGYGFGVGLNVVENLVQFLFAAIVPVSSASAFVAVKNKDMLLLGVIMIASLAFLGLVVYGLWRGERHRSLIPMLLFSLLGLVPAIFMNHVGELYLYNSMPFIAVLVGAGLGTMLERTRQSQRPLTVLGFRLFLGIITVSHIVGIQTKAAVMMDNGDRAARYLPQIASMVDKVPQGGTLLLLNPQSQEPEYSVFLMKPLSVFKWGVHIIKQETNRWDMTVEVIEQEDLDVNGTKANMLVLRLQEDKDSIVVARLPGGDVPGK